MTKSSAKKIVPITLNHAHVADVGDLALDALMKSLDAPVAEIDEKTLNAAVSGAEAIDVMVASATPSGVIDGFTPTGDSSDVVAEPVAKTPKAAAIPRKHYSDITERLKDKLGTRLGEYSVLTMADAGVDDEQLKVVMETTLQTIRDMNKKEQKWAVKFIEYLDGKKAALSEVTGMILTALNKDGVITMGNDGNVFKALVARPYSPGSARAMGGNNVGMLEDLKLILADGKGRYIANPDSLLLIKVRSMMAAGPAAAAPAKAEKPEKVAKVKAEKPVKAAKPAKAAKAAKADKRPKAKKVEAVEPESDEVMEEAESEETIEA